jgi:hypothetical protein
MLQRDYYFEFAGMPQCGKTTVMEIIRDFLEGSGYPIAEYRGRSRYSPLYTAPIEDLNLSLACNAVNFTVSAIGIEKEEHKIYLLDKGLIDRCIFTDTLVKHRKVSEPEAEKIKDFLTVPRLLEKLDGIFIFVTLPWVALEREYGDKPPQPGREVMNESFLSDMYSTIMDDYCNPLNFYVKNTQIIRTDEVNEQETVEFVGSNILNTISEYNQGKVK